MAAGTGAAGGGALLGIEAEIAAAHAQIALLESEIAMGEAALASGAYDAVQAMFVQQAIAMARTQISSLWAYINFLLSLL